WRAAGGTSPNVHTANASRGYLQEEEEEEETRAGGGQCLVRGRVKMGEWGGSAYPARGLRRRWPGGSSRLRTCRRWARRASGERWAPRRACSRRCRTPE